MHAQQEANLRAIAAQLGLDGDRLIALTGEDPHEGANPPGDGTRPYATPWTADGKLLYALVRALKPRRVLESGCNHGGSANHILAALKANGDGHLVTVDINPQAGGHIDPAYEGMVEVVIADISDYVHWPEAGGFDFIHEDASHEVHTVRAVYEHLPKLSPLGCVILSHDVATGVGEAIRTGMHDAGYDDVPEYASPDAPLGFSVMRYEGEPHAVE